MPVAIKGSGGGSVSLTAGAAASDTTLTLPNTDGTVIFSNTSGDVGIGTSSPVTKLDVTGIVTVRNNSAAFNTTPNTNYGLNFQAASSGVTYITSYSSGGSTDIAFATNSGGGAAAERMRITSDGRVGIGTSNPLQRFTAVNTSITGGAPASSGSSTDPNAVSRFQAGSVVMDFGVYPAGQMWIQNRAASNYALNYDLVLQPNGGNVGIGTSAPTQPLDINGNIAITGTARRITGDFSNATLANRMLFQTATVNGASSIGVIPNGSSTFANLNLFSSSDPSNTSIGQFVNTGSEVRLSSTISGTGTNLPMTFFNSGSERMRITPGGNLSLGTTSDTYRLNSVSDAATYSSWLANSNAAPYGLYIQHTAVSPNNSGNEFLTCWDATTNRFRVNSNGGISNYSANDVNLSDRREKANFAPAKSYLEAICAIPVQTFNYNDQNLEDDPGLTLGVVAQDVQVVAPELVTESNWGTDENPKYRLSVYQTDLQYALMKCIQELSAKNDALEARLAALEAK